MAMFCAGRNRKRTPFDARLHYLNAEFGLYQVTY